MRKSLSILVVLIGFLILPKIYAQNFEWAFKNTESVVPGYGIQMGKDVHTDDSGNIYVVGTFGDSIGIGQYLIKSFTSSNTFVAKFNSAGEPQWAKSFGATSKLYPDAPTQNFSATDGAGNTYVSLYMTNGRVDGTDYATGGYLIKFDTDGNVSWVVESDPKSQCKVALDANDDIYICGAQGASGFKMSKYGKDGTFVSSFMDNAGLFNTPSEFALDDAGNIYITGGCPMFAGNLSGTAVAVGDYFVAKYDNAGTNLWVKTAANAGYEIGYAISISGSGEITIAGAQLASQILGGVEDMDFGGVQVNGASNFVLRMDTDGNATMGTGLTGTVTSMKADVSGNIYVTGGFQIVAHFGADSLTGGDVGQHGGDGLGTAFIVKYDSKGDIVWLNSITGYHKEWGNGIALDKSNNVYVTGQFHTEAIFGADTLVQTGVGGAYPFIFLTKIAQTATDVRELSSAFPAKFSLAQNYPNPFNPATKIRYSIASANSGSVPVKLVVFDALGGEVMVLVNTEQSPGLYEVPFNAANLSSGIYFYKLSAGTFTSIKKMVLLR